MDYTRATEGRLRARANMLYKTVQVLRGRPDYSDQKVKDAEALYLGQWQELVAAVEGMPGMSSTFRHHLAALQVRLDRTAPPVA